MSPRIFRNPNSLRRSSLSLLAVAAAFFGGASASAQVADPLIDVLVRKGVLTDKEADEVRAELEKEYKNTSAAKVKLSDSVQELRLYGDLRLRYQYDNKDFQEDPPEVGARGPFDDEDRSPSGTQRSRWRFRLRLNADFKLAENFFGGVELQTAIASDSANETFQDGFRDYPIFISRAYVGWSPNEWLTFTGGKIPNPFFSTELTWDPDINPTGISETVAFHKLWAREPVVVDGKTVVQAESPWEFTLIAGQFIFDDNLEGGGRDPGFTDNDETTDAYLFETQLVVAYKFSKDVKLTIAPAWFVYNAASADGLENTNPFQDSALVSGATRNLNMLLVPGELAFKLAGQKSKLIWDFAYNFDGRKRVEDTYRLPGQYEEKDNFAFLVGLQFRETKKKGDWAVFANYRRNPLGAIDPNLNDSDFGDSELNTHGFKVGFVYGLTDFATFALTYQQAWQIRDIRGGEATRDEAIADANAVQTFQADLNVKF